MRPLIYWRYNVKLWLGVNGGAIQRLKQHEPPDGYYLGFSGGKDSIVIYDIAVKA